MKTEQAKRIHTDNIAEYSARMALTAEQRALSVAELTDLFIDNRQSTSPLDTYADFLQVFPQSTPTDRALFLSRLMSGRKSDISLWSKKGNNDSAISPGSHGKIAALKNQYSETAFSLLSKAVTRPKAVHVQTFTEACEAVTDNRCQFCILPTETSNGGRLFGFYSLLDKYELKIYAVCSVESEESDESVRYALVGRSLPDRFQKGTERTLECSITAEDGGFPIDIPAILNIFGAKILRIDSLPSEYDELQNKYYLSFRLSERNAIIMDLYLSNEHQNYSQIGLYPTIE